MTTPWTYPLPTITDVSGNRDDHARDQERKARKAVLPMASSLVKALDDDGVPGLRAARLEWTSTPGLPSGPGYSHDRGPASGTLAGLARDLSTRTDVPAWLPTVLRALARVSDGAAPLGRGGFVDDSPRPPVLFPVAARCFPKDQTPPALNRHAPLSVQA